MHRDFSLTHHFDLWLLPRFLLVVSKRDASRLSAKYPPHHLNSYVNLQGVRLRVRGHQVDGRIDRTRLNHLSFVIVTLFENADFFPGSLLIMSPPMTALTAKSLLGRMAKRAPAGNDSKTNKAYQKTLHVLAPKSQSKLTVTVGPPFQVAISPALAQQKQDRPSYLPPQDTLPTKSLATPALTEAVSPSSICPFAGQLAFPLPNMPIFPLPTKKIACKGTIFSLGIFSNRQTGYTRGFLTIT